MGQVSLYRLKSTPLEKKFSGASWYKHTWPMPRYRYGSTCIWKFGLRQNVGKANRLEQVSIVVSAIGRQSMNVRLWNFGHIYIFIYLIALLLH